ncbi:zincin-like metallopeptidase domain-containing protein [Flavobacteriaceae bacterium 14752]|uniref:zincin-like metallopeptidase domain-containing protein n=1 Tax=Mesohalobacter salilacus TaxID=2491711 RepID=UPI000F637399|nr:DUF1738 domain-containing protein [Flavobacteriaceae bacterium 14752]
MNLINKYNSLDGEIVNREVLQNMLNEAKASNIEVVAQKLSKALQHDSLRFKVQLKDKLNPLEALGLKGLTELFEKAPDKTLIGLQKAVTPKEIFDNISKDILDAIDNSGDLEWRKPWKNKYGFSATNFVSKKPYSGINSLYLNLIYPMIKNRKFDIPYFLTFKQIQKNKGKLKKGSSAFRVYYYDLFYIFESEETGKIFSYKEKEFEKELREKVKNTSFDDIPLDTLVENSTRAFIKYYNVFNADDIEGIDWGISQVKNKEKAEKIKSAEALIDAYKDKPNVSIENSNRAFYSPPKDHLVMPEPEQFDNIQEFYSTYFHELIHSTGHEKRTGRLKGVKGKFGDFEYSKEELVAELGAVFLCAESGILYHTLDNSKAYLQGWKKRLKKNIEENNRFFTQAAAQAQAAVNYMLKDYQPEFISVNNKKLKPKDKSQNFKPGVYHRVFVIPKTGDKVTDHQFIKTKKEAEKIYNSYLKKDNVEILTWEKRTYNKNKQVTSVEDVKIQAFPDHKKTNNKKTSKKKKAKFKVGDKVLFTNKPLKIISKKYESGVWLYQANDGNEYVESMLNKPKAESNKKNTVKTTAKNSQKNKKTNNNKASSKSKPKKTTVKTTVKKDNNTLVVKTSSIKTDEKRFQNRSKLNQRLVNQIVNNFSLAQFDPPVVWKDPKDNKTYILAGHHRLEAIKRLDKKEIPVRYFEGTEKQAIRFAKVESNANRTLETPFERAKIYREMINDGVSKKELEKKAKIEGKNKNFILNLAHLSDNGIVISTLQALENGQDVQDQQTLNKVADWIGQARRQFTDLSNAHEREMFDFLMDNKASKRITTKVEFLQKINSIVQTLDFNKNKPLNLKRFKFKSEGENQFDEEVRELKSNINDALDKIQYIKNRFTDSSRSDFISQDKENFDSLRELADGNIKDLNDDIKVWQKKLIELQRNKSKFINAGSNQGALFGAKKGLRQPKSISVKPNPTLKEAKDYALEKYAGKKYFNKDIGKHINVSKSNIKKAASGRGQTNLNRRLLLYVIDRIIQSSRLIKTEVNRNEINKNSYITNGKIVINNRVINYRLRLNEGGNGVIYYDHYGIEIKKSAITEPNKGYPSIESTLNNKYKKNNGLNQSFTKNSKTYKRKKSAWSSTRKAWQDVAKKSGLHHTQVKSKHTEKWYVWEVINGLRVPKNEAWCPKYHQFKNKPQKAIKHLMKVKKGDAVSALFREDIGYIDIIWGENDPITNKGFGLKHIIEKHGNEIKELGFKVENFIPIIVLFGNYNQSKKNKNRIELTGDTFKIVISKKAFGKDKNFVLTAFDLRPSKKKGLMGVFEDINVEKLRKHNKNVIGAGFTMPPLYSSTLVSDYKNSKNKDLGQTVTKNSKIQNGASLNNDVEPEFWEIGGETGKFLQRVEKKPTHSIAITLDGDKGSGKTTTIYKFMNDFSKAGKTLCATLEISPDSILTTEKKEQYIDDPGLVDFIGDFDNKQEFYEIIQDYDFIFIDSWQKLLEMIGFINFDIDLRKKFDGKVFVVVFQQTTNGKTRGGAKIGFDGDIIIKVTKEKVFTDNFAWFDKHRYTLVDTSDIRYNVASGKVHFSSDTTNNTEENTTSENDASKNIDVDSNFVIS